MNDIIKAVRGDLYKKDIEMFDSILGYGLDIRNHLSMSCEKEEDKEYLLMKYECLLDLYPEYVEVFLVGSDLIVLYKRSDLNNHTVTVTVIGSMMGFVIGRKGKNLDYTLKHLLMDIDHTIKVKQIKVQEQEDESIIDKKIKEFVAYVKSVDIDDYMGTQKEGWVSSDDWCWDD